jgi:hypothetical protein
MNVQMGNAPSFRCDLSDGYSGGQTALSLYKCDLDEAQLRDESWTTS